MPVKLTSEEAGLLQRVSAYCGRGLTETEMAEAEGTKLTSFRNRLLYLGFTISKTVRREVVRTGSDEPALELFEAGEIVVVDEVAA
jgi:hypothetical protein